MPKFDLPSGLEALINLLPGLLTLIVVRSTSHAHRKIEAAPFTIFALVYTLVANIFFELARWSYPAFEFWPKVVVLSAISVAVGLLLGFANHYRWPQTVCVWLHLDSALMPSPWQAAFQFQRDKWIQVDLKDGTCIYGWPIEPPIERKDGDLVLGKVRCLVNEQWESELSGVVLIPGDEIKRIRFMPTLQASSGPPTGPSTPAQLTDDDKKDLSQKII